MRSLRLLCLLSLLPVLGHAQLTSQTDERLKQGLKMYPEADTDKDGILTMPEALAHLQKMKKGGAGAGKKGKTEEGKPGALKPDHADVAYDKHERCKLDLYLAKNATTSTPLVIMIHGGGFRAGDKAQWGSNKTTKDLLDKGISCAALNYPFLDSMPIQDILRECGRAVQYLRSRSGEWNLDKTRFASMGGSAGAGTSLWLATHDDLADPKAEDPVLRESTRLTCAVCNGTQATYDVTRWESFLGKAGPEVRTSEAEAALFYHLPSVEAFGTDSGKAILRECDMLSWITKDDPPLLVSNSQVVDTPKNRGEWLHCIHHAREVSKECAADGVPCIVVQDQPEPKTDTLDFLVSHLLKTKA
ncbi:alpha/beta hydrolase [Brevifollis gellanilyticus]|uniref:BD-FAE-like domain-containing protein n=1 Tax=Brevifollis gellanilyticus TaxID=748831 RepID=A0A512M5I4_9BACT|nr:alpha/beta hydrolase [Brevifollis gellanilyticus]GEP41997.1 hypothetical protein BGE01nite_12880 [Brevifollis gellanilyticus]